MFLPAGTFFFSYCLILPTASDQEMVMAATDRMIFSSDMSIEVFGETFVVE